MLFGALMSKGVFKRIAEYGDGWIPFDGVFDLERGLTVLRQEGERVGRAMSEFDLSVIIAYSPAGGSSTEKRIRELMQLGFNRVLFVLEPGLPDAQWPVLEQFASLVKKFQ